MCLAPKNCSPDLDFYREVMLANNLRQKRKTISIAQLTEIGFVIHKAEYGNGIDMTKITISLIRADVGSFPGHSFVHPALIETAESRLKQAMNRAP